MKDHLNSTFGERYKIIPDNYAHIRVENLNFSNRLRNRLLFLEISSVSELLKMTEAELRNVKGLGQNCFEELYGYFRTLQKDRLVEESKQFVCPTSLYPYIDNIKLGNFEFAEAINLNDNIERYILFAKESHNTLDQFLIDECIDRTREAFEIQEMLNGFVQEMETETELRKMINPIPKKRLELNLRRVLFAYTDDENIHEGLVEGLNNTEMTLEEFLRLSKKEISNKSSLLRMFSEWCRFDVKTEVSNFFQQFMNDERTNKIVLMRTEGGTLEQVGHELKLTRERVRQLEKKIGDKFEKWQKNNRILMKIFLDANEESVMSSCEIVDMLGAWGEQFLYFMKNNEYDNTIYDEQLDLFVIGNSTVVENARNYVENMPETFTESSLDNYLVQAEEIFGYPEKVVLALVDDSYKKTGVTYHRSSFTLEKLYQEVMQTYYPNGMQVYDEQEIEKFRKVVKTNYGIVLEQTDRAVGALIARVSILCGRGKYRTKKEKYISEELAEKIYTYIEESESPIFLTNTLFSVFEQELVQEGIDNKYYLQGVLHELFGGRWNFRRDYVSKDDSVTSIYSEIVRFIKQSPFPVKKQELYDAFPGVTEIVLNIATSDSTIINLFGEYVHSSYLKLSGGDVKYLQSVLMMCLQRNRFCHCAEIYDFVYKDNPSLLTNNFVNYAFSMYSLLEYLFGEKYNFSRPMIAHIDVQIEGMYAVLKEIVRQSDEIELVEISNISHDYHFNINSILEFADSCNDTHLLVNKEKLQKISDIGINEDIAREIEILILEEIQTSQPIVNLKCLTKLPHINVRWNEWLIYSLLKKWSSVLEVAPSYNQLRYAIPIVAPVGKLSSEYIGIDVINEVGSMAIADDLDNIDDLIADYILEDLEDA